MHGGHLWNSGGFGANGVCKQIMERQEMYGTHLSDKNLVLSGNRYDIWYVNIWILLILINMEPQESPTWKGKHLPNLHCWVQNVNFPKCYTWYFFFRHWFKIDICGCLLEDPPCLDLVIVFHPESVCGEMNNEEIIYCFKRLHQNIHLKSI